MLGSFKKSFKQSGEYSTHIPRGIIEAMNMELPEGFKYQDVGDGLCILTFPEGSSFRGVMQIEGASKEQLSLCKNVNDLFDYASNLQKDIRIMPNEDGYYIIGEEKFSRADIIKSPLSDYVMEEGNFLILTPRFNQKFDAPIEIDGIKYLFCMERVPNDSVRIRKFVNSNYKGIILTIEGAEDGKSINISIRIDLESAQSVSEICDCIAVYNGFVEGRSSIFGTKLNEKGKADKAYSKEVICFWNNVKKLEEVLNLRFDVTKTLTNTDVDFLNRLSCSLLKNKPYRIDKHINSLDGDADENTEKELNPMIGNDILFRYVQGYRAEIMGQEIECYELTFIFDSHVSDTNLDTNTGKFHVDITDSEGKKMYIAAKIYLDENAVNEVLDDEQFDLQLFKEAETIDKLLLVY